jgi:hypothetical protein
MIIKYVEPVSKTLSNIRTLRCSAGGGQNADGTNGLGRWSVIPFAGKKLNQKQFIFYGLNGLNWQTGKPYFAPY